MKHTTKDGMAIEVGTEIYYTGDMANASAFGRVTDIVSDRWGVHVTIEFDPDECDGSVRPSTIIPVVCFEPSPGRRFMTKQRHVEEREAAIERMRLEYARVARKG